MEPSDSSEKLRENYSKAKQFNKILKDALKKRNSEYEALVENIRENEIQNRKSIEQIDELLMQQNRLNQQINELNTHIHQLEKSKSSGSSWTTTFSLNRKQTNEELEKLQKLQNEYLILKEELEFKINENEDIHMQLFETRRLRQQDVKNLENKITQIEYQLQSLNELLKEKDVEVSQHKLELQNVNEECNRLNDKYVEEHRSFLSESKRHAALEEGFTDLVTSVYVDLAAKLSFDDRRLPLLSLLNINWSPQLIEIRKKNEKSMKLLNAIVRYCECCATVYEMWGRALHPLGAAVSDGGGDVYVAVEASHLSVVASGFEERLQFTTKNLISNTKNLSNCFAEVASRVCKIKQIFFDVTEGIEQQDDEMKRIVSELMTTIKNLCYFYKRFVEYQTLMITIEEAALSGDAITSSPFFIFAKKQYTSTEFIDGLMHIYQTSNGIIRSLHLLLTTDVCLNPKLSDQYFNQLSTSILQNMMECTSIDSKLSEVKHTDRSAYVHSREALSVLKRYKMSGSKGVIDKRWISYGCEEVDDEVMEEQRIVAICKNLMKLFGFLYKQWDVIEKCVSIRMCNPRIVGRQTMPLSGGSKEMVQLVESLRVMCEVLNKSNISYLLDEYIKHQFLNPDAIKANLLFDKTAFKRTQKKMLECRQLLNGPHDNSNQLKELRHELKSAVEREEAMKAAAQRWEEAAASAQQLATQLEMQLETLQSKAIILHDLSETSNDSTSQPKEIRYCSTYFEKPKTFRSTCNSITSKNGLNDWSDSDESMQCIGDIDDPPSLTERDRSHYVGTNGSHAVKEVGDIQMYQRQIKKLQLRLKKSEIKKNEFEEEAKVALEILREKDVECDVLRKESNILIKQMDAANDALAITQKNYNEQMQVLTERICELSSDRIDKDNNISIVHSKKIKCIKCDRCTTIGYLMKSSSEGVCRYCNTQLLLTSP